MANTMFDLSYLSFFKQLMLGALDVQKPNIFVTTYYRAHT